MASIVFHDSESLRRKLGQVKSLIPQSAKDKIILDNHLLNGKFKVEFEVWV